jgi:sulfur relay (sulfurtransferase) DsrF/TusC family protein
VGRRVLIVVRRTPLGFRQPYEALRVGLAMWVDEWAPTVLCEGDGVFLALRRPARASPALGRMLAEVTDCEIPVCVVAEDAGSRGLQPGDLLPEARLVPWAEAGRLLSDHDLVVAF